MKHPLFRLLLTVTLVVGMGVSIAGTAAASTAPPDPCSKPVSQRTGPWTCTATATTTTTSPVKTAAVSPLTATGPFCMLLHNVGGCWTVDLGTYTSYFHTNNVTFGYDGRTLGTVNLNLAWQMSGPAVKFTTTQIRNSAATFMTAWQGKIYNGTTGVVGSLKNQTGHFIVGSKPGGTLISFGSQSSYDNESWDHHGYMVFSWVLPAYRNITFFMRIRSNVGHSTDKKIYRLTSYKDLPGSPWQTGWWDTTPYPFAPVTNGQ